MKNGTRSRVQKRNPRRLLEAPKSDWQRWDAAARMEGLNWSDFTRRALLARVAYVDELATSDPIAARAMLPGLSEKPAPKNGSAKRAKPRAAGAREKGSSRS